jgi:hypothetical protein
MLIHQDLLTFTLIKIVSHKPHASPACVIEKSNRCMDNGTQHTADLDLQAFRQCAPSPIIIQVAFKVG